MSNSPKRWLLYGATGYTGRLIVAAAKERGMEPIIGGRHGPRVTELAQQFSCDARVFSLDCRRTVVDHLRDVTCVLHCAGPFFRTTTPMLTACLHAGTHYLDVTGEIAVFESIFARSQQCQDAGICAIPGVGFDVVPSDYLAFRLKEKLPSATELKLAFRPRIGGLSPGTTRTMVSQLHRSGAIRKGGRIVLVPSAYRTRTIPFAVGERSAMTIPWGDVSTAYHTTQIPNIEVYLGAPRRAIFFAKLMRTIRWGFAIPAVRSALESMVQRFVQGPSPSVRRHDKTDLWGMASDASGASATMTMTTGNGYDLTAQAALAAVQRILEGENIAPGASTPTLAFGPELLESLPDVTIDT